MFPANHVLRGAAIELALRERYNFVSLLKAMKVVSIARRC